MATVEVFLRSRAVEATERFARELGARVGEGAVVALDGELGAGKTAFVRGFARGLGVEERITSPTYALHHSYPGRIELHHLDAWMEGRERAFLVDGGAEWILGRGVLIVEWASRVADCLPRDTLWIELAHAGVEARTLRIAWEAPAEDLDVDPWRAVFARWPAIDALDLERDANGVFAGALRVH